MSQATIERPVAQKTAGKPAVRAADQREKIVWMFSELLMGIAAMVESEEGDCLGRVLEFAGGSVRRAAQEFAASDADMSYHTMLDADSFIQAAAALAAHEETQNSRMRRRGQPGRSTETRRLADLSDSIATAQDQRLTDITSGKVVAITAPVEVAAPAADPVPAVEPDAPDVVLTAEAARLVSNCTYQIETLILMMQDMARRTDDETTSVHLPIVVQALGVRIEQLNQCITDTVYPSDVGPSPAEVRDKVEGQCPRLMRSIATQPEPA